VSGEKPFKPSKRKLEKARKEGKVLKSQVVTQAVAICSTALAALFFCFTSLVRNKILLEYVFIEGFRRPFECFRLVWAEFIKIGIYSLACGCVFSLAVEVLQVGLHFVPTGLAPSFSRIGLGGYTKRVMEGLKGLWLRVLSVLVLGLWGLYLVGCLRSMANQMFFYPFSRVVMFFDYWCLGLFISLGVVLLGLGGLEYLVRRRFFLKELGMSYQEVRQEHKEVEGDPNQKSARRLMHESLLQQDIIARVRRSRVIIVGR